MNINKKEPPRIHYYDQDFVDVYDKTWAFIKDSWVKGSGDSPFSKLFFSHPGAETISQVDAAFSSFFLVYSNSVYSPLTLLDNFYSRQEESGAIRGEYDIASGKAVLTSENPEGILPPLFAWAEFNVYHKIGLKRRVKEVMPILEKHFNWMEATFKKENGLYSVPMAGTMLPSVCRENTAYAVDFNAVMAMHALYISAMGDILNDKDIAFRYKKHYFSLKTRINSLMWNEEDGFYYDLDAEGQQIRAKSLGAYWTLMAEIPNEDRADRITSLLKNEKHFGTPHPFPSVSASEPTFQKTGQGPNGSVYPSLTFMVIKGLEKYGKYELARESAIKHMYYVLDTLHPDSKEKGALWEAYLPTKEGKSQWEDRPHFPRENHMASIALSTVTLMIENVVGLFISLPRKTVDWIVPTLELMGIEGLSLKRNFITILSSKSGRGWEIRLESEKLYYFTIDILNRKKKTLPIPSGKCSMLIDKL